jgi:hypothetical protein
MANGRLVRVGTSIRLATMHVGTFSHGLKMQNCQSRKRIRRESESSTERFDQLDNECPFSYAVTAPTGRVATPCGTIPQCPYQQSLGLNGLELFTHLSRRLARRSRPSEPGQNRAIGSSIASQSSLMHDPDSCSIYNESSPASHPLSMMMYGMLKRGMASWGLVQRIRRMPCALPNDMCHHLVAVWKSRLCLCYRNNLYLIIISIDQNRPVDSLSYRCFRSLMLFPARSYSVTAHSRRT